MFVRVSFQIFTQKGGNEQNAIFVHSLAVDQRPIAQLPLTFVFRDAAQYACRVNFAETNLEKSGAKFSDPL